MSFARIWQTLGPGGRQQPSLTLMPLGVPTSRKSSEELPDSGMGKDNMERIHKLIERRRESFEKS